MKQIIMRYFPLATVLLVFCYGCGSGKGDKQDGISTEKNDTTSIVKSDATPILPTNIEKGERPNRATLYMDISGSMKGYVNTSKDSRFSGVISSFAYVPHHTSVSLFGIKEQQAIEVDDFLNLLNERKIKWSVESNLKEMIESMVKKLGTGECDVCMLVTDGIMSGTNEQIRNSPERAYSVRYRTVMSNSIKNILASRSDLSALIVAYKSFFNGTYYCYTNEQGILKEKERPFYIIAIGSNKSITYIKEEIEKRKNEEIGAYEHFLVVGEELPYNIHFSHSKGLKTNSTRPGLIIEKSARMDSIYFSAEISSLPIYMQDRKYLANNTFLYVKHKNKNEIKLNANVYNIAVEKDNNRCKAIISIATNRLSRGCQLRIHVKYSLPEWIEKKSCDDDREISNDVSLQNKTFNFKYLIEGFSSFIKSDCIKEETFLFAD